LFFKQPFEGKQMRTMIRLTVAAAAIALGAAAIQPACAADMLVPQAQAPAPAYYPPPAQAYAYPPPPPIAYYAPPPVAYYAPAYAVWPGPGPYYARWGYWRGYGPRFAYGYGPHVAYGYGRWGHGNWGHGWHR
jgi:hypothetical protein